MGVDYSEWWASISGNAWASITWNRGRLQVAISRLAGLALMEAGAESDRGAMERPADASVAFKIGLGDAESRWSEAAKHASSIPSAMWSAVLHLKACDHGRGNQPTAFGKRWRVLQAALLRRFLCRSLRRRARLEVQASFGLAFRHHRSVCWHVRNAAV